MLPDRLSQLLPPSGEGSWAPWLLWGRQARLLLAECGAGFSERVLLPTRSQVLRDRMLCCHRNSRGEQDGPDEGRSWPQGTADRPAIVPRWQRGLEAWDPAEIASPGPRPTRRGTPGRCVWKQVIFERLLEQHGPNEAIIAFSLTEDVFLRSSTWARWQLVISLPAD